LSDRGTQYYTNLGETCRFLEHLKSKGVQHIYASIKKPTTCGKLERFWGTHNRERWNFTSLRKFINYYNHKRPHMSLGYYTPHAIYIKDMK
ncbi:MAG: transposase, partial [Nanoarchaeota archaeon]|nr:transposase [Nanoarchaeota archaeon]